ADHDQQGKFFLYRDVLKVQEYFLFDPREEYLDPSLQGFRLVEGEYVRIEPADGRLPSEVLGLHLERDGVELRFYNPATGQWLQTPQEIREQLYEEALARKEAEILARREAEARRRAEDERQREAQARQQAEAGRAQEAE